MNIKGNRTKHMKNLLSYLICAFSITMVLCSCKNSSKNQEKRPIKNDYPNIVLLVGDDQGYPYFGFMGADYVETPYMDRLAQSGTLFTNGYVPENHCRPSLQTLMTGTLPIDYNKKVHELMQREIASKAFDSDEERLDWIKAYKHNAMKHFKTLPKYLSDIGYKSFQGGKWWEFNYQNGGFDEGMTKGWTKADEKNKDWFLLFMGGDGRKLARATMQPVYDFIDKNSDSPFFIWYAPELPHYPFDAPDKYYNIYKNKDMSESAKRYYANCTWFDDGVGELQNYLKEKGEFNSTLFIYVNDNGWEQSPRQEFRSDSLRWHNGGDKGKLSMYDQSFRTPIIFSWKDRIPENTTNTNLIHSADIPATILDILGQTTPDNYFGKSYKKVIEGNNQNLRTEIIGNINQMRSEEDMMGINVEGYWLRNKDWFFNWNITLNTKELYSMINDTNNDYNLIEKHPELVKEFTNKINSWKEKKGR